jgi:hypothetical protein
VLALRDLRESTWPGRELTQAQLAKAFSSEGRVARSLEGEPHLISEDQLTKVDLDRFRDLESKLLALLYPENRKTRRSFQFDAGPVIVICPTAPPDVQGPLADEQDPNFIKMRQYGDIDALIELYGHLRAENPNLEIFHRTTTAVVADDFSSHVVLLGGIGWNKVTARFQRATSQANIEQAPVGHLEGGDIFKVQAPGGPQSFYSEYEDLGDGKELIADVGYIARLRNPFQHSRTLTICNGIHSRGVFGAVRCLTDTRVRAGNEKYLAERFPNGEFAILLRIPVVENQTLSPDLQDPSARLYEWAPSKDGAD